MPCGVLECDIVMLQNMLHAYDFVVKDFVMKMGVICARPCICLILESVQTSKGAIKSYNHTIGTKIKESKGRTEDTVNTIGEEQVSEKALQKRQCLKCIFQR